MVRFYSSVASKYSVVSKSRAAFFRCARITRQASCNPHGNYNKLCISKLEQPPVVHKCSSNNLATFESKDASPDLMSIFVVSDPRSQSFTANEFMLECLSIIT